MTLLQTFTHDMLRGLFSQRGIRFEYEDGRKVEIGWSKSKGLYWVDEYTEDGGLDGDTVFADSFEVMDSVIVFYAEDEVATTVTLNMDSMMMMFGPLKIW